MIRRNIDYLGIDPLRDEEKEDILMMLERGEVVYIFIYRNKYLYSDVEWIGYGPGIPAFVIASKKYYPTGYKYNFY